MNEGSKPDDAGLVFFCGRCGQGRTARRGGSCDACRQRYEEEQQLWKRLGCRICGEQADSYCVSGVYCHAHHNHMGETNSNTFVGDGVVGIVL